MATILIGYDLNKAGQDYSTLIAQIKSIGSTWWHCLDSTWIVKVDKSASDVRDDLKSHVDANDELLVIDISACAAAWLGFDQACSDWLKANL